LPSGCPHSVSVGPKRPNAAPHTRPHHFGAPQPEINPLGSWSALLVGACARRRRPPGPRHRCGAEGCARRRLGKRVYAPRWFGKLLPKLVQMLGLGKGCWLAHGWQLTCGGKERLGWHTIGGNRLSGGGQCGHRLAKSCQRVGKELAKSWHRVGKELAESWQRVGNIVGNIGGKSIACMLANVGEESPASGCGRRLAAPRANIGTCGQRLAHRHRSVLARNCQRCPTTRCKHLHMYDFWDEVESALQRDAR